MFVSKSKYNKALETIESLKLEVEAINEDKNRVEAVFAKQGGELLKSQELVKSLMEDVAMLLHDLEDRDLESLISERILNKSLERVEKARAFVKDAFANSPTGRLMGLGGIDVLENGQVKELSFQTQAELEAILSRAESGELEIVDQKGL